MYIYMSAATVYVSCHRISSRCTTVLFCFPTRSKDITVKMYVGLTYPNIRLYDPLPPFCV